MSLPPNVFFDESLPTFVRALAEHLGVDALKQGLIVRDSSGRLRFLASEVQPAEQMRVDIEKQIANVLGAYARQDGAIAFKDEPGVQRLLKDPEAFLMRDNTLTFRLLDSRIIGSAWLNDPQERTANPPRIVFASLKGDRKSVV